MRYRLSRQADNDLERIWGFIATDSPRQADRLLDTIHTRLHKLARSPLLGTACPELSPSLRFLAVKSYVIYYRPLAEGIEIVRVLHGARDIKSLFPSD